jgi:aspartate-semialdehyde dehydrogenase
VIDSTSAFSQDPEVPLVVPDVNGHCIGQYRARLTVASPNCATIPLVRVLKPLRDHAGVVRVNVVVCQGASRAGRRGLEELAGQTARLLNAQEIEPEVFPGQIAFNLLPQIGDVQASGYTQDEEALAAETRRILEDDAIDVHATFVQVPVFHGQAAAVHLETRSVITAAEVRSLLSAVPGVQIVDEAASGGFPTPVTHAAGSDDVFVGRIRPHRFRTSGVDLWMVSDDVRASAALNSVQIAEVLIKRLK